MASASFTWRIGRRKTERNLHSRKMARRKDTLLKKEEEERKDHFLRNHKAIFGTRIQFPLDRRFQTESNGGIITRPILVDFREKFTRVTENYVHGLRYSSLMSMDYCQEGAVVVREGILSGQVTSNVGLLYVCDKNNDPLGITVLLTNDLFPGTSRSDLNHTGVMVFGIRDFLMTGLPPPWDNEAKVIDDKGKPIVSLKGFKRSQRRKESRRHR